LADVLTDEGYEVASAADGSEALALIEVNDFDLVITDLRMPNLDGVALLERLRQLRPQTLVLLMTAYASVETAVEALRQGAHDYMIKPLVYEDVLAKFARLLEHRSLAWQIQHLRREVESRFDFEGLIGQSVGMKSIVERIRKVGPTDSTVLISGESGVGKEVVARLVHRQSMRSERIFLPINCGAIPDTLLESQLFGHVRGAFTGAVTGQEGLLQRARSGTIFLDEIGELPLGLQVKLLRVLETKEVLPIGATDPIKVDIRIVAATNRNLEESCRKGEFREDLYYRLNVFGIEIPPLRERREDIPLLIDFLVRRHNVEMNRHFKGVENAAMKLLLGVPWKGNVRELDNVIEHAMILGAGDWIRVGDLPTSVASMGAPLGGGVTDDLKTVTHAFERNHIENVLGRCDGDKRQAADQLGISLSSLYRKIEELEVATD
jgi:two-component system response regulator PilR (NtrC family)